MTDIVVVELDETAGPRPASHAARLGALVGLPVTALHPTSTDPRLRRWYYAGIPAHRDAAEIVGRLRQDPYVSAAYVKPPDAAP
jgi:hypothetical protein